MPTPNCQFHDGSSTHKPGLLSITGIAPTLLEEKTFPLRVCVDCLDAACDALKDQGYKALRITAPEGGVYQAHRR